MEWFVCDRTKINVSWQYVSSVGKRKTSFEAEMGEGVRRVQIAENYFSFHFNQCFRLGKVGRILGAWNIVFAV